MRKAFFAIIFALCAPLIAAPATAATIPFVGCPTNADWGNVTPTGQPITVNMPDDIAAKLALYVGVYNLRVLAPRGWTCSGGEAVGGNRISIGPPGSSLDNLAIITVSTAFDNLGGTAGISQYVHYFPKIISMQEAISDSANWDKSPDQYIIKKYAADTLTYLSNSTLEFGTPANKLGLGDVFLPVRDHTPEPASLATYGVISISFDDGTMLQLFSMHLPQNLSYLHTYITDFAASCFLKKPSCAIVSNNLGDAGDQ